MAEAKPMSRRGSPSICQASGQVTGRELEFSTSSAQTISDTAFVHIDIENGQPADVEISVSAVLHYCKLKILKPYFRLLSILGWRPLIQEATLFETTLWTRLVNWTYYIFIIAFILTGYVLQYALCYRQDGFPPYVPLFQKLDTGQPAGPRQVIINIPPEDFLMLMNTSFKLIQTDHELSVTRLNQSTLNLTDDDNENKNDFNKCSGNFVTLYLLPNILHFFAYLCMRSSAESEKLENLMERGFLQTTRTPDSHIKFIRNLRSFLWLCLSWVILSFSTHILHVIAFQEFYFTWMDPTSKIVSRLLSCITITTLTWSDVICAAIVTSYAVHCQLNTTYLYNLCGSIREKRIDFQEFYKRVEESRKFIDYLNNDQALGVSLLLVNFGCRTSVAFYGLVSRRSIIDWNVQSISVVLMSTILWLSLLIVPIIQAVRLTVACKMLRIIGHELRSRPFGYQDTSQEDLDSFLLYTSNLRIEGRILHIPLRPSIIVITSLAILFVILFMGQLGILKF